MRKSYTLISVLFCVLALQLQAQKNLIKGFEAVKVFNYFEAHKTFKEELRKDKIPLITDSITNVKGYKNPQEPAAAAYGLATIFVRTDNPFSNADSAYQYANLASYFYVLSSLEQRNKLIEKGIPVDSVAIITLYGQIYQRAYNEAKAINTIPAYQSYIDRFPFSGYVREVKQTIEDLDWAIALKENTYQTWQRFVTTYPKSARLAEAQSKYELRLFESQTADGSIEAFQNFNANNATSPYRLQSEDSIYAKSTYAGKVENYALFIRQYPANRNVDKAWDRLYNLYNADGTEATLNRFKAEFPDYPRMEQLRGDIQLAGMMLLPFVEGEKWGYIDTTGNQIIGAAYDYAEMFYDGLAVIQVNGKTGYINKAGKLVIDTLFEEATAFDGNYAIAKKNGKYGVIGRVGNTVLPFEYDDISSINKLVAGNGNTIYTVVFTQGAKQGYIDITGTVKYPTDFEEAGDFFQNMAVVKKDGKYGYISADGIIAIACQYEWAGNFGDNGLARIKQNGLLGLINRTNQTIAPCKYTTLNDFQYGLAVVTADGKSGYINQQGAEVIPLQYPFALPFAYNAMLNDTIAKVEYKNKRGFILKNDKSALPIRYDDMLNPTEGLVGVKEKGKWGFVDKNMKVVIPIKFEMVGPFKNGMAVAMLKGKKGLIDKKGKWVIQPLYDEIYDNYANDVYVIVLADDYGLIDTKGAELLPAVYEEPELIFGTIYQLVTEEKTAYYDIKKKVFIWKE